MSNNPFMVDISYRALGGAKNNMLLKKACALRTKKFFMIARRCHTLLPTFFEKVLPKTKEFHLL